MGKLTYELPHAQSGRDILTAAGVRPSGLGIFAYWVKVLGFGIVETLDGWEVKGVT